MTNKELEAKYSEIKENFQKRVDREVYGRDMKLRDWFAGQALAGDAAKNANSDVPKVIAQYAYQIADAMLEARR